jgi:hypothetical protein
MELHPLGVSPSPWRNTSAPRGEVPVVGVDMARTDEGRHKMLPIITMMVRRQSMVELSLTV